MKDITTFETAVRLKEAGFPQPTPQPGQFWYDGDKELYVIYCDESPYIHAVFIGDDHAGFCEKQNEYDVLAPTATDILREMPGFCICYLDNGNSEGWTTLNYYKEYCTFNAKSPAEAAAEAWIKLNDKK